MKKLFCPFILAGSLFISNIFATDEKLTLTYEEVGRSMPSGNKKIPDTDIVIRLIPPPEIPVNTSLSLSIHRSTGIFTQYRLMKLENGNLVSLGHFDELRDDQSPFLLVLNNYLPGEVVSCTLSREGSADHGASTAITPYPLEVTDDMGHSLTLRPVSQKKNYCYSCTGFKPNEKVKVMFYGYPFESYKEERASSQGKIFGYVPAEISKDGYFSVEVISEDSNSIQIYSYYNHLIWHFYNSPSLIN